MRTDDPGRVVCAAGSLWLDGGDTGSWRVRIADVVAVGEYTTANGPYVDDYFLVFIGRDRTVYEASCYAIGVERALSELGFALRSAPFELGLCNSTDWKTRVLWPAHLVDTELFVLEPKPPSGFWQQVLALAGLKPHTAVLAPRLDEYLKSL